MGRRLSVQQCLVSSSFLAMAGALGACAARTGISEISVNDNHDESAMGWRKRGSIEMEPIVIVGRQDPLIGLDAYDASTLLDMGNALHRGGQSERALLIFDAIFTRFPDSVHLSASLYNSGLVLESLGRHEDALSRYQLLIADFGTTKDGRDAYFRAAGCLGSLNRWKESAELLSLLQTRTDIDPLVRIEATILEGKAWFMMAEYLTAEDRLMRALSYYRSLRESSEAIEARHLIAMGRFYLSRLFHTYFDAAPLELPQEKLELQLEEKCRHLLRAQTQYLKTIREGDPYWASAAGLQIGKLYESLYDTLLKAPIPPELTVEQTDIYREELRSRVAVLVRKAIRIYERSLSMAQRTRMENDWVDETQKSLERMKNVYLETLHEDSEGD